MLSYDIGFVYRRTDGRTRWNQYTPSNFVAGGITSYIHFWGSKQILRIVNKLWHNHDCTLDHTFQPDLRHIIMIIMTSNNVNLSCISRFSCKEKNHTHSSNLLYNLKHNMSTFLQPTQIQYLYIHISFNIHPLIILILSWWTGNFRSKSGNCSFFLSHLFYIPIDSIDNHLFKPVIKKKKIVLYLLYIWYFKLT
jgi:hypothetical protein